MSAPPSSHESLSARTARLPLELGDSGAAVADLQQRLRRLGYEIGDAEGEFGSATANALASFQRARGLRVDGVCARSTWSSLVEAGFRLGDRVLYLRHPMAQGDDVAQLQRQLSSLGFDPGRVDGIFGDNTASALADFQHNIGLVSDGICGPQTLAELHRLATRRGGDDLVSVVRDELHMSAGHGLKGRTIVVGEQGGFQVGAAAVARALAAVGAEPLTLHQPDEEEQAAAANLVDAHCYVGLRLDPERLGVRTLYYSGYRYESEPSKHLASLILARVVDSIGLEDEGSEGVAYDILRHTRMPAVLVELGSPVTIVMHTLPLAAAIVECLVEWTEKDWR